jgi:ATPase involved in DNA replication initiation
MTYSINWPGIIGKQKRRSMREIAEEVAAQQGVVMDLLRSDTRRHSVSHARQDAMRLQRVEGYSYPQIGAFWGRDHTTVVYGVRAAEARA